MEIFKEIPYFLRMNYENSSSGSGFFSNTPSGKSPEGSRKNQQGGLLGRTELFSGLSQENRDRLRSSAKEITRSKGEHLFHEGEGGDSFYLLIEGAVKLYRMSEDSREVTVRLLKGGEIFGEVILFNKEDYPVSSVLLGDSKLLKFSRSDFLTHLKEEVFRNEFIAALMGKQRYLSGRIHYLAAYDVEERFFLFLKETWGIRDSYEIPLSKKDIASAIGTVPETFSRLIARLKKRGVIDWKQRNLTVKEDFWSEFE